MYRKKEKGQIKRDILKECFKQYVIENGRMPNYAYLQEISGLSVGSIGTYLQNIKLDEDVFELLLEYKLIESEDVEKETIKDMKTIKANNKQIVNSYCKKNNSLKVPYFQAQRLGIERWQNV